MFFKWSNFFNKKHVFFLFKRETSNIQVPVSSLLFVSPQRRPSGRCSWSPAVRPHLCVEAPGSRLSGWCVWAPQPVRLCRIARLAPAQLANDKPPPGPEPRTSPLQTQTSSLEGILPKPLHCQADLRPRRPEKTCTQCRTEGTRQWRSVAEEPQLPRCDGPPEKGLIALSLCLSASFWSDVSAICNGAFSWS